MAARLISIPLVLSLALASPAAAQNAGQIARVRAGAACPRCNLFQADLANLTLKRRNLAGARLRQADMSAAVATGARFVGGDLRDLNAYGAVMGAADFSRADLTNASFVGAYLQGADFKGAKLGGVNFSGAEMDRARGLAPRQLSEACGDPATKLPRGLHLKPCA